MSADVVGFSGNAAGDHLDQGAGVVLDVEPVADLGPGAVDRERFPVERVEDHQRNQFFRKVVRAVIVRTVGHHRRESEGSPPRPDQMVARCFARRIGRTWRIGGVLPEELLRSSKVAVDLVGRNVVEAEPFLLLGVERGEVGARRFQQRVGADHVGPDEFAGAVDRTVDMALRRQMHDRVGLEAMEHRVERVPVADVDLFETETGIVRDFGKGFQVAGIGEFVHHADSMRRLPDQQPAERRSDEAGAAGDQYVSIHFIFSPGFHFEIQN